MRSVVCIKQVPDSAQIRIHPVTNTIMRQGVPSIINPYDLYAIEAALRLKDQHGGTVTVLSMGPKMAEEALRRALSFGCDRAILVTDRMFAGSDTLATSFVLATAMNHLLAEGPIDMLFCGKQSIDGDTAQVGPGIACRLGFQQLTYVEAIRSVDAQARKVVVERRAEGGVQVMETALPCMITMLEGTNTIRRGSLDDALRAARADVEHWDAAFAGITDNTQCGLRGSPTVVRKVFVPKAKATKAEQISMDGGAAQAAAAAITTLFAGRAGLEEDLARLSAQSSKEARI